jgi:hypothetical protein
MSFLYRNKELGPVGPTENYVYVNDSEPVTVLSFAFEGEYTFFNYNRGLKKLYRALASQNKWVQVGEPRAFNYNSPFVWSKWGEI